jgi:hypothetical protein
MTSTDLHPIGPDLLRHNRRVLAERLGWPEGAVDACAALEAEFPRWMVFWSAGGLPVSPEPAYRAVLQLFGHHSALRAPTAEDLRTQIAAVDAGLPGPEWPWQNLPPLTDPS